MQSVYFGKGDTIDPIRPIDFVLPFARETIDLESRMDIKLNSQDLWRATALFLSLDLLVLVPLIIVARSTSPQQLTKTIFPASALFWGITAMLLVLGSWNLYYRYFFPAWMRWLTPLETLVYALIAIGLWWLAMRLPESALLWFALLGGLEGVAEHILGIYGLRILEKVPWLQEVKASEAILFSFFEYVFYWTLVAWLAMGLLKILRFFTT